MSGRRLGIICAALFFVAGCSRSEQDNSGVLQALATRTEALNNRNVASYIAVISPQYNDKGKSFTILKDNLEKSFSDCEQIVYEAGTPSIHIAGNRAESTGSYRMRVRLRGKEMTLNGTEHLTLAKEPKGWKIIAGI